jgi:hypothetical protein
MPEKSAAYQWFWEKMDALTQSRPLSAEQRKQYQSEQAIARFRKFKASIDTLKEFLGDAGKLVELLEKEKFDVGPAKSFIGRIAGPINLISTINEITDDALVAAEDVSRELAGWYNKAEAEARRASGGDDDQYFILSAAITRLWQARNVKAVLGSQPDSFVNRLWPKWRDRLFHLVF